MKQSLAIAGAAVLLAVALFWPATTRGEQPVHMKVRAPELRDIDEWLNTKPLHLKDLRGKVVVLHFWTFG